MTLGIRQDFRYTRRTEKGVQSPDETLQSRCGSCRDFAVLMMEATRSLGLAARFVSGYIFVPGMDSGVTTAAVQLMRGCRLTCRAQAGSTSIRPTVSWATAI